MTTLTQDQATALEQIRSFLKDDTTAFLLEGGAGVGKTFLLGEVLKLTDESRCVCAPTHKAINVLRRKLEAFGVEWVRGFDDYTWNGEVITGTTAQLLGVAPVIMEEQTATEIKFGKTGRGILSKITPHLTVIDEVSMLGWFDFSHIREHFKKAGVKMIAVGDSAQLPPVKQQAIPFERFVKNRATLRQIVRQAEGSAIIKLAWAIRDGKPWLKIKGQGIERSKDVTAAFLDVVQSPNGRAEEEREVFIAYRNMVVDAVQEAACQRVYKHGRKAFARGEMVLAETNFYREKVLLCANQDELIVERFEEKAKDKVLGVPVVLRHRVGMKGSFLSHYIPPEDLKDPAHPYNAELRKRSEQARKLEEQKKSTPHGYQRQAIDDARRRAWRAFFEWRDQTIISFRHPFAITSHKSQGSTYRAVYADTADLAKKSSQALYVAVTRPKESLVIPA